ncbi:ACP S-malonyltransferase [Propionibacterium australiense]|uniref:[acyl-carrier-protein] S-malonyltransferase n=1 Tax=Propionibacterium australiense TaxID=119981 RepID=A0A383S5D0_9ACTN|nr:ACP S-malonyltransferase [Propionibacterium australiense]RLP08893.1 acyltransferase domain-containing protein [Propionibacterium australiense]RLP11731.1 acyltransferase domain-containing protein [Propionibacterium australiense]SYZ32476.1 [acyl-carrier-protein] S-malonyltransferase [Propionibacterium australiense]VEH90135.1 Malonyl CoA-acyl carrier protein transacylase [Propionibacterium australiense]
MLVIVAPGQGAQTPGFLTPWLEIDAFAQGLSQLSEVTGLDLAELGTSADADTIKDTAVAQPLLMGAGLYAARVAAPQFELGLFSLADAAAGHSVGEITAAAGVGVLDPKQAALFIRERGRGMAEASAVRPTGMTAVVSGDRDEVLARIAECGLTAANHNGSGQIVAAGTLEQLQALRDEPPSRARVVPLAVAGAFHTDHMAPAQPRLAELAATMTTADPATRLLSNRDGRVVASGAEYLQRLVDQVTTPVRWDLCMDTMRELGVTGLLELPPAKTLTGIAKRNLKGVELFTFNTPDQIDEALAFCQEHAGTAAQEA